MAVLIFADRTDSRLFALPVLWHQTREFHVLICLTLGFGAAVLLKSSSARTDGPHCPRPVFKTVKMFSRSNCPLCDHAMEVLERYETLLPDVEIVLIEHDPELIRRFGESVPVIEIDGKIRFRGGINPALLQRLIDGKNGMS